jgi:cysteinyl-tRNA synthetase
MIRFFNTLTRKKEIFKPIHGKEVRLYTCGPTVYATPHIGNYRSFFMADLIRRYLEFRGFTVKHVMNITDIDDKTIRDSSKEGLTLKEFTDKYTKVFFDGLDALNIKKAWVYPRATENVEDMIRIVRSLVKKGYAYITSDGVYYDISKFKQYGRLSKLNLKKIKIGARVDVDEYAKNAPQDFALMKRSTAEELKRGIYYDTEWGNVRPGWHIECSALSMKFLGDTLDIHTGGVDLIFPHHENEIAQSEAYTGKRFVNYWLHGEFLLVNGEKMAKSLGNVLYLDYIAKNFGYESIRYIFASIHYRKKFNYTDKLAENARRNYEKLKETHDNLQSALESAGKGRNKEFLQRLKKIRERFIGAMDDNLNSPVALKVFHELSKTINKYLDKKRNKKDLIEALNLFNEFSEVFGFRFETKKQELPEEIEKLIRERDDARKKGDWESADRIRKELMDKSIIIEDTPKGTKWKVSRK